MQQAVAGLDQSLLSRFESIKGKLFSRDKIHILPAWSQRQDSRNVWFTIESSVSNLAELQGYLNTHLSGGSDNVIIMIPQEYSWGRLCITESAFKSVVDSMQTFPSFLELTGSFGFKVDGEERAFHGWRGCALSGKCSAEKHEICYNIQYVEKHGRMLKDPWSLRQTGVYHQYRGRANQSRWILISPSDPVKTQITGLVETQDSKASFDQCSMDIWALHVHLLLQLGSNWTEYIEYLGSELREQNNKACYSSVECTEGHSYTVSYADLQELHMIEAKFQTAKATIDSSINIAKGCRFHLIAHEDCIPHDPTSNWKRIHYLLDVYEADMIRHLAQLQALESRLRSTLKLSTKLLMFRNEELLHSSNQSSCKTLNAILDLTDQGKQQQEVLNGLLHHGRADSVMLKALSVVATVCLPASLIATIFSSNLVVSGDSQAHGSNPRLIVSSQFWVYIAITAPLMAIVLIWVLYMDHKSRRAISSKVESGV